MLKNPATGGTHWFHGTPNTFGQFRSTDDLDFHNMTHPAWNSGIGHHFTSLHEVANRFVSGGNGEPNPNGWHIHAKLSVENPKHYASEHDMLHHAAQIIDPANEHQRVFHHKGQVHDLPISVDDSGPLSTETHLKLKPGSAKRFREHLIRQGHDGITYGNEYEGPKGHACAIVFHRDQIKEADRHAGHAPDLPDEHVAKKKRHDNSHHVKHKHRVSHSPGWPGYHPWCTGFYFGGGYIGHDGACPAHDGGGSAPADADSSGDGGGSVGGGGDGGGSMGSHRHVATVLTDWKPDQRLFAPTQETTDPRLFDPQNKMRPEVRTAILDSIDNQWKQHADWRGWAKVYLAGSEASKWWGNNDFDILVGVDYSAFRSANPRYSDLTDEEITSALNRGFAATYNNEEWHPPFRPDEVWHRTGYCNLRSYDIRRIKPYAAYDVGNDLWAVEPPDEPQGHQFDPSQWYYAEGVAEQIKNVLRLPEPERTQQAKRLWTFLHEDRSRAFGPDGTGAYDRGNMVEKYLDQSGLWEQLVALRFGKTGSIPQEDGYHDGHGSHLAGKGKPRSVPRRGQDGAEAPGQAEQEDGLGQPRGDEEAARPQVVWHPKTDSDMKRMSGPLKQKVADRVDLLASQGRHSSTHSLGEGLPGWHATSVDHLHRIVHQQRGNTLYVGYVGPHDYDKARRRLGALSWEDHFTDDACTACGGSGEQGTGHECYICDGSGDGSEERANRARGVTNDNPGNGLAVGLDLAKGQQPKVAAIKLQCADCGEDYFTDGEKHGCTKTAGLSRDQSKCDHNGPHNLHGQCKACGYMEPTEGDEPCDSEHCKGFPDGWHTKGEHHDPPHMDPNSDQYRDAEKAINEAMGDDHTWLLDQQHQGPSHLSSKTAGQWESETNLKKRMDAESALREHLALHHPTLVNSSKSHAVMDMYHRLSHGTVGPQQQLDLNAHPHDDLINPSQPFSVRHKDARVKVVPSDGDDSKAGIMIAIAPPARIVEDLVLPEGESAENLHITIAYLGDLDEHSEAQIDMLPELVEAWAEGQPKLDARIQGAGTFVNQGSHVLWAAADIPGVNEMHVSLVQYLTGHGFDVRKNHSFTPHITLAYGTTHFRFLPKIEPTSWKVREVWCCIGGRWESFPLRG